MTYSITTKSLSVFRSVFVGRSGGILTTIARDMETKRNYSNAGVKSANTCRRLKNKVAVVTASTDG